MNQSTDNQPWRNATSEEPCPVCAKPDWCSLLGPDGAPDRVVCMRVKSDNQRANGGWFHWVDGPARVTLVTPPAARRTGDRTKPKRRYATLESLLSGLGGPSPSRVDRYHDANGRLVGAAIRQDLPDGGKRVLPARLDADGQWRLGAMPSPRPLFALHELTGGDGPVVVVEGEKVAAALRAVGVNATTWSGGCKASGKTDFSPLAGREVILLPDNDAPGREAMASVTEMLAVLDPSPGVKRLELSDLPGGEPMPEGGDAFDWLHAGGEPGELIALLQNASAIDLCEDRGPKATGWRPKVVCIADVEPKAVSWLWAGKIPAGRISLLAGAPGVGKSFLTCDLAARISTGAEWPGGAPAPQGSVLLISSEDGAAETIRPRLDAHGADTSRIHLLNGSECVEGGRLKSGSFTLGDLEVLRRSLDPLPDCRLVVIDPIGSFLGPRLDAYRDNEVRSVLAPLAQLAEEQGAAVLLVAHHRKSAGSMADDTVLGSRAFTGIARTVWHLVRDPEARERRLLLPGKSNLASEQPGLVFAIGGDPARLTWEDRTIDLSADAGLAASSDKNAGSSSLAEATEWLLLQLANGQLPSGELRQAALRDGISWRTLQRAKVPLRVHCGPGGYGKPWVWRLQAKAPDARNRSESSECAKGE